MKLLTRIALDIRRGARWTQTACLLILLVAISSNVLVLVWTRNLSWVELGLTMISTLTLMLALGKYITTSNG